jgi:hypothetical protein
MRWTHTFPLTLEARQERFAHAADRMRFQVVDLVSEDLLQHPEVAATVACEGGAQNNVLLHTRHLMFHLAISENLQVLDRLEKLAADIKERKPGARVYAMLSTHLQLNENDAEYVRASERASERARPDKKAIYGKSGQSRAFGEVAQSLPTNKCHLRRELAFGEVTHSPPANFPFAIASLAGTSSPTGTRSICSRLPSVWSTRSTSCMMATATSTWACGS